MAIFESFSPPPLFWVFSWVSLNILLTILNKSVFVFIHFPYPMTLSLVHMFTSAFLSYLVIDVMKWVKTQQIDRSYEYKLVMFSGLFTLNIIFGNLSLKVATVSFGQVVRSIIPAFSMALSYLMLRRVYSNRVKLTLIPVIIGVAFATYGEVDFNMAGLVILLIGCFLAALKVVLSNKFLVGQYKLHPIDLLRRMAPLAGLQMLILALVFGEIDAIVERSDELMQPTPVLMILSTGLISFFLNFTNFMTNKTTSPLTVTVAGNLKTALTICLSVVVFSNTITFFNGLGIMITIIGTVLYSLADYQAKQAAKPVLPTTSVNSSNEKSGEYSRLLEK